MKKIVVFILACGLFSMLWAQDAVNLDKSVYFKGKKDFAYLDGFVHVYLPNGYSLIDEEVESRTYIDFNNNMQFEPSHTDTYLQAGRLKLKLISSGGDIIATSGDFETLSKNFTKTFLADYVFEKKDNNQAYKATESLKQTELDYGLKIEGKLQSSFGVVKMMSFQSEAFTYDDKPYIGITYIERKIFKDKTVYDTFSRHVALVSKGVLVVARVNYFHNEKSADWETVFKAVTPILNGVLPAIPSENIELAQEIVGSWESSKTTTIGYSMNDDNLMNVNTTRKITFYAGGNYVQSGFTGISGNTIFGGAEFKGQKGSFKIYGQRLVLKSESGGILTYYIDKPEPNFLTLDGNGYIRIK